MPASSALAFGALLGGAIVMEYGIRSMRDATSASASAVPVSAGAGVSGGNHQQIMTQLASQHGWDSQQVTYWEDVVGREDSSYSLTATNSQTGAYGIAQMLATGSTPTNTAPDKAKYATYGGNADTLVGQLTAMANYIKDTYGTPAAAWAHEQEHGWY